MVAQLVIQPQGAGADQGDAEHRTVRAALSLPDDEEIAVCRIAVSSQSRGKSSVMLSALCGEVRALLAGLSLLGVESEFDAGTKTLSVRGVGLDELHSPGQTIDARGHARVAALLIGLCVSRKFVIELLVDPVVAHCLLPVLAQKHALQVEDLDESSSGEGVLVRLLPIAEGERAEGISLRDDGVFSWVKQATLLAGLRARSKTVFEEQLATPDHMERVLLRSRVPLDADGSCIVLHPPRDPDALAPQKYEPIGSAQMALAVVAAATAWPHGQLVLRDVSLNPARTLMIPLLRGIGYHAATIAEGDRQGEPIGKMVVQWGEPEGPGRLRPGRALNVTGQTALAVSDGALWLMAMASISPEAWVFADLVAQGRGSDPRVWGRAFGLLRSAGVRYEEGQEGSHLVGGTNGPLRSVRWTSGGDGRLVLLASALSLRGLETSVIDDVACLRDVFPKWVGTLKALGAKVEVRDA